MMKLTAMQKDWMYNTFFNTPDAKKYAGALGIAYTLMENGRSITTPDAEKIWVGGIGNFIKSRPYENVVGLIELTFDIESFMSKENSFFMDTYENDREIRDRKHAETMREYEAIIAEFENHRADIASLLETVQ